jgi:multimeric flavodoxin WrbA
MKEADGIILGSPVHFSDISAEMKAFLDRAIYVGSANNSLYRHKVGVGIAAVRRSGGLPAFNQLNNYLTYAEMVIPGSNYWNVIYGRAPKEVLQDEEGKQILRILGKNMVWLLKLIEFGEGKVQKPEYERKVYTHFIR